MSRSLGRSWSGQSDIAMVNSFVLALESIGSLLALTKNFADSTLLKCALQPLCKVQARIYQTPKLPVLRLAASLAVLLCGSTQY